MEDKFVIKGRHIFRFAAGEYGVNTVYRLDYEEFTNKLTPIIDTYKFGVLPPNIIGVKLKKDYLFYLFYNYDVSKVKIFYQTATDRERGIKRSAVIKRYPRIWVTIIDIKNENEPRKYSLYALVNGEVFIYPSFNVGTTGNVCMGQTSVAPENIDQVFWCETLFTEENINYPPFLIKDFYTKGIKVPLVNPNLGGGLVKTLPELWGAI